jgi:uncharacterized protein (TIGR02246 family)
MTSQEADRHAARIRELDEAWKQAAERHDLDGMMAIYAADARELPAGMPDIVGRDAIRAFYQELLDSFPRFSNEFTVEEIVVSASNDLAVAHGTYRFTPDTDQPGTSQAGKFVGVWRRLDGDWRLAMNISNSGEPTTGRP